MNADDVLEVVRFFEDMGCPVWIGGGWGVDALVGHRTRKHSDLDLAFPSHAVQRVLDGLRRRGFQTTTDWLPSRIALRDADGREVDLHPLTFNDDGSAEQPALDGTVFHYSADCFVTGSIGAHAVPCLSAVQQLRFRRGYEHHAKDKHDVALLRMVQNSPS